MTTLPPPVDALAAWVGQTIASDDPRAAAVLSAASNLVTAYAGKVSEWTPGVEVPADVGDIVVQVAARVYLSPPNSNVRQWTKGPFGEGYFDAAQNGLSLTSKEEATLDRFRSTASGLGVLSVTRGEGLSDTIYVPTGPEPAGYPFPWYAADGY
jgi:hypothetical protein